MKIKMKKRKRIAFLLTIVFMSVFFSIGCANTDQKTNKTGSADKEETAQTTLTVTALDVGKADAFLLKTTDFTALIDTATEEEGENVVTFLESQGIKTIDLLIITHFDKDHVGGADQVIKAFEVKRVISAVQAKESEDVDEFYNALKKKDLEDEIITQMQEFMADGVRFEIYPPEKESYEKKESNNSSLVVRVTVGEKSMLFTGDAQEERIEELLAMDDLQSDVLKMPHHGKLEDNTEALIRHVAPDYAVITSSEDDLEDAEVLSLLEDLGVKVFLTRNGEITITISADEVLVEQK